MRERRFNGGGLRSSEHSTCIRLVDQPECAVESQVPVKAGSPDVYPCFGGLKDDHSFFHELGITDIQCEDVLPSCP